MSKQEAELNLKLEFEVPDAQAPGFLKRQRRAMEFAEKFEAERTDPSVLDEMVEFLADFVVIPDDRKQAKEALWNASQEQFEAMLDAITGATAQPDPQSGEPSENG